MARKFRSPPLCVFLLSPILKLAGVPAKHRNFSFSLGQQHRLKKGGAFTVSSSFKGPKNLSKPAIKVGGKQRRTFCYMAFGGRGRNGFGGGGFHAAKQVKFELFPTCRSWMSLKSLSRSVR
ncbi:uncharacterized protein [Coffea arabica]|uniref:Secreted protein n=1 Tax=Coffea arabica TaxID=13443 RepID=A0ABM4W3M4_COFAR